MNVVTDKIKTIRHETEGVQIVDHRLSKIQKMFKTAEAHVKSPLDLHKGVKEMETAGKILAAFYLEYNDVFVKNPKLHDKVSALMDKVVEGNRIYDITKELFLQNRILKENKELLAKQKAQRSDYVKRAGNKFETQLKVVHDDRLQVEKFKKKKEILTKKFKETKDPEVAKQFEANSLAIQAAQEKLAQAKIQTGNMQKEMHRVLESYDQNIEGTLRDIDFTEALIGGLKKELKAARAE